MDNIPEKVNVNYNLLKELFLSAGIKNSIPPTEEELQQLVLTIREKLSTIEKDHFEPIRNLLALDPIERDEKVKNNILVVDDLVMVTYQLSILLSKMGYKVTLARSAPEAISHFKSHLFSHVLMDLYLPEKEDGLFLLSSLKNKIDMENLPTKIIVMSGTANASSVEYCLNNGARTFVEKNDDWKKEILRCIEKC
jgi:CheY-like chemotaxis protein